MQIHSTPKNREIKKSTYKSDDSVTRTISSLTYLLNRIKIANQSAFRRKTECLKKNR